MATQTTNRVQITIPLEEAATLCRIDPQILRNWVSGGWIRPAVLGGKGRGNSHRFTPQQVVGLATVNGLHCSTQGCNADFFIRTFQKFEAWTWSATEQFLGLRNDDWSKEEFAKSLPPVAAPVTGKLHPDDEKMIIEYGESLIRLRRELQKAVRVHPAYSKERMEKSKSK